MIEAQILKIQTLIETANLAEDDFMNALRELQACGLPPVSILKKTKIGKTLNALAAKAAHEQVRILAKCIEQEWRHAYRALISGSIAEGKHESNSCLTPKRSANVAISSSPIKKPHTALDLDAADRSKHFSRDRVRKLLFDAVNSCQSSVKEVVIKDHESVTPHMKKPDLFAAEIELALFDHMRSDKEYRAQARSIAFNLKDDNNATFRLKVLFGQISPQQFPTLTPEDMASDATRLLRAQTRDEAMKAADVEAYSRSGVGNLQGIFTCEECQSVETINFQIPSGKPDTAPTIVVICTA